jgi:hypothetical protein
MWQRSRTYDQALRFFRAKNSPALKNKNKTKNLPVVWQHNLRARVTGMTFNEWFHKCFISEVEEYLAKGGLPLKFFLMIDNAPGQPHSISIEDKNVQVVFLPPNTTALLQPLDQSIIRCVTYSALMEKHDFYCSVLP